jgi:hypothetical protein
MKKILLAVYLWLSIPSLAQRTYLKIPDLINDRMTISHIVDSLKHRKELNAYLVYQRVGDGNRVVSYLVCSKTKSTHVWIISRDSVLENQKLDKQHIFYYKGIAATGATVEENTLEFKPPMLSVVNNEIVVYSNIKTKVKFYFEYGDNITTYEPLAQKDKYRKGWLEIIRKSLL